MITELSANTQAILLLTAPLIVGRRTPPAGVLQPREYNKLAQFLHANSREPADLLSPEGSQLLDDDWLRPQIDSDRVSRLLARGFLLSQAVEKWQQRAIWVLSRADDQYPRRLKARLRGQAPPILYGCGDREILDAGGLAVVGSRHVDDDLLDYAAGIGELAACAEWTLVSGGARGIDQAAMRGALRVAQGKAIGVLGNDLQRAALNRENREFLVDGRLVLVSPYDPAAGFNVGNVMRRNKHIYALADAALVVNADYRKGGTWAGAEEQLKRLRAARKGQELAPVYVRPAPEQSPSPRWFGALIDGGARPWPDPQTPEEFWEELASGQVQVVPALSSVADTSSDLQVGMAEQLSFFDSDEGVPAVRAAARPERAGAVRGGREFDRTALQPWSPQRPGFEATTHRVRNPVAKATRRPVIRSIRQRRIPALGPEIPTRR